MKIRGLYIVSLNSEIPVSVNANDPRIADRCIKVARGNCKFGKAHDLAARERSYAKVFEGSADFFPIVALDDIAGAERVVLEKLEKYRIRGFTGRKNEWLQKIPPVKIERIALDALRASRIKFTRLHRMSP